MAIPIPDFGGLAQIQGGIGQGYADQQTLANRPGQFNPWGNVQWSKGQDGSWTQTTNMTPGGQQLFDQTMAGSGTLAGQIGQGINYGGVPGLMDAAGTSQQAIDANMNLMNPMLQQQRSAKEAQLAAMGIPINSRAMSTTQRNLGNSESDAYQKAILAGNQEYGNIFNRALQARQQGVNEVNQQYQGNLQGMAGLTNLRDSLDPTKHLANVPGATGYNPPNMYNAAMDTYNAQLAQENAGLARGDAQKAGYMNLAGSLLQGQGGNILSGAKSLWDWGKGLFGMSSLGGDSSGGNNMGSDLFGYYNDASSYW